MDVVGGAVDGADRAIEIVFNMALDVIVKPVFEVRTDCRSAVFCSQNGMNPDPCERVRQIDPPFNLVSEVEAVGNG